MPGYNNAKPLQQLLDIFGEIRACVRLNSLKFQKFLKSLNSAHFVPSSSQKVGMKLGTKCAEFFTNLKKKNSAHFVLSSSENKKKIV